MKVKLSLLWPAFVNRLTVTDVLPVGKTMYRVWQDNFRTLTSFYGAESVGTIPDAARKELSDQINWWLLCSKKAALVFHDKVPSLYRFWGCGITSRAAYFESEPRLINGDWFAGEGNGRVTDGWELDDSWRGRLVARQILSDTHLTVEVTPLERLDDKIRIDKLLEHHMVNVDLQPSTAQPKTRAEIDFAIRELEALSDN